jgi:hypothetical protein
LLFFDGLEGMLDELSQGCESSSQIAPETAVSLALSGGILGDKIVY